MMQGVMRLLARLIASISPVGTVRSGQCRVCDEPLPQHFLNFLPDPQGQGSFLPTFVDRTGSERGNGRSGSRQ